MFRYKPLTPWLSRQNDLLFSFIAGAAAFCTYACMYAFRKPFSAATLQGYEGFFGMDYKDAIILFQLTGYVLSKFVGIKVISEAYSRNKALSLLILIGISHTVLLFYGIVPPKWNGVLLFFNGLPLGMLWGLVFSYLEGRRFTEIMGLMLCGSFIWSSGVVRDIGVWVIEGLGVSEFMMPWVTGLFFALPLVFFLWLLEQMPEPRPDEVSYKGARVNMDGPARREFFLNYAFGLILLIVAYIAITGYRDYRDNFMANIWEELGLQISFSSVETWVAAGVTLSLMLLAVFKSNRTAVLWNHIAIVIGLLLVGASTWSYQSGLISAPLWMGCTGFGAYLAYLPYNSILYDRIVAASKRPSNTAFLIYTADAFGYLGVFILFFWRNYFSGGMNYTKFFIQTSYGICGLGFILISISAVYFWRKLPHRRD